MNNLFIIDFCNAPNSTYSTPQAPYSTLDSRTHSKLLPSIQSAYAASQPIHLTASYGLFRRMTGVGGRPELALEGANSLKGPWEEYEFPYKPGSLDRMMPIVGRNSFNPLRTKFFFSSLFWT